VPEEVEELENLPQRKKVSVVVIVLLILVIIQISLIITMYMAWAVSKSVATREKAAQGVVLEEEKRTATTVLLAGDNKDKSFNAYIARGEDQASLAVQIRLSLGISNQALAKILEVNPHPIQDRMLAYFSQKTKRDIIYSFQRKILGEELKEIANAILEKDLGIEELGGRVTKVHVTKLIFITL